MKNDCMTNTPYTIDGLSADSPFFVYTRHDTIQQEKILLKMGTAKKVEYLFLRDDKMFFSDKED